MRTLALNSKTFFPDTDKKNYILLGDESIEKKPFFLKNILPKLRKKGKKKIKGLWGTLGMYNDSRVTWSGKLKFSRQGNEQSVGVTSKEIELIQLANPHLKKENLRVVEHFISFEDVSFDYPDEFTQDDIPRFRLTIMLEPDEGALCYYQYHEGDGFDNEDDAIDYILPKSTDDKHSTDKRDRLNYEIEALPPRQIEENPGNEKKPFKLSGIINPVSFVIKILVYKRGKYKSSIKAVNGQLSNISQALEQRFENESKLLIFNYDENEFFDVDPAKIDRSKKTLLLIHGALNNTLGSFGPLVETKWFKALIDDGIITQVIAFEHPTLFKDAKDNIETMCKMLGPKKFTNPVDLIGSSQGGLLVKYLANLEADKKPFIVNKIALIASANGIDYVNSAANFSKMMSVFKQMSAKSGRPALAFICSLSQHSVDFMLKLPGIDLVKPNGEKLLDIMNGQPNNPGSKYLPLINQFTKELVKDQKFFKRISRIGIDLVVRSMMGKYNDWVVNTKYQFKVPVNHCYFKDYNPDKFEDYVIPSIHGQCLEKSVAREKLRNFLMDN